MSKITNSPPAMATPAAISNHPLKKAKDRHVLFACYDFSIGGHSTHTLNFARALRTRDWRVGVLVLEPFGALYGDFEEGLDYTSIVRRGLESRTAYLHRLVNEIVTLNPDVIINNGVQAIQAALPFLPSQVRRISVVHNYAESEVALGLANGPWVDWAVAVSDNVREFLEHKNRDRVRLATIPVGIVLPERARVQEQASTPLRLIYVGRLEAQKNLPGLLRVLDHLQKASVPFSMTIVGGGRELQSLRSQAAASDFCDKVEFLGVRTQRQVALLLDRHDFLIMTSHYEGTPHAILEAMAHGLVVVASRLPGATDRIITDKVNGFLCDRNDPDQYVAVLQRFIDAPGEFGPISTAARETAMSRYGTDCLALQYESLFQNVNSERERRLPEQFNGNLVLLPELQANFPGLAFQCKHRVADVWRRVAHGRRPIQKGICR